MNTKIGCIACQQACIGIYGPSPSPSLEASLDDEVDDDKDDVDSSGDDEMTTFQWLTICHSWQKGWVVLGLWVVLYLKGELV